MYIFIKNKYRSLESFCNIQKFMKLSPEKCFVDYCKVFPQTVNIRKYSFRDPKMIEDPRDFTLE